MGGHAGAAYVFERNQGGLDQWGQTQKLAAADGEAGAAFGHAVGVSGDLIIVGAPDDDPDFVVAGSAYVFSRDEGGINQWGQVRKLLPFDGEDGDEFGFSVTIDGELMAVGTHLDYDGNSQSDDKAGAVYLYARNYPGLAPWSLLEKLVPLRFDGGNDDGLVVSLSQNTLAVGAHFAGSSQNGRTFIYRLKYNNPPIVAQPIPDQLATLNKPFSYALPLGTFTDPDVGDILTLSLSLTPPTPAWLSFDPTTATFSGTPDTAGTNPVVVVATDLDGASVTASFDICVPGKAAVALSALALWRQACFNAQALADPAQESTVWGDNADPDGDGVSNLQEYLFGTDPRHANPGDASTLKIARGIYPNTVSAIFQRRTDDPSLLYVLETSSDLTQWQPVDPALILQISTAPVSAGVELVTAQIQVPTLVAQPQFFRIKAILLVPGVP